MEERVLTRVRLNDAHRPAGATRRYGIGGPLPAPSELQIKQYADGTILLLYLNEHGEELADTWHETLEKAKEQAAFEFNVRDADWD